MNGRHARHAGKGDLGKATAPSLIALFALGIAAALDAFAAPSLPAAPPSSTASPSPASATVQQVVRVYYFHTTQRCASCRKIEALSAEAIREGFERELGNGTLEWQPVNLDDPPNRHFIQDYTLYTKSLVVAEFVNGERARWKNLPKIWELLRDEPAFRQYVEREVRAFVEHRP